MPGQIFDPETGFHYNYHRYYDPRTGRYLTPDPIGMAGGINLYTYAVNNPVMFTDPEGLESAAGTVGPVPIPLPLPPGPGTAWNNMFVKSNQRLLNKAYGMGYNTLDYVSETLFGGGFGEWLYDATHPIIAEDITGESIQDIIDKIKAENEAKLDTCEGETRQPIPFPGPDPDPGPPKGPWWKRALWKVGQIVRLFNNWPS